MSEHEHVLPLLSDTKFLHWKYRIVAHCMIENLRDHLRSDLVAAESDIALKPSLLEKKNSTAEILVKYMGAENVARFVTEENRHQPHQIWELLCDHYQSQSLRNKVKVYREFLDIRFSTLDQFINDINYGIASLLSVGLTIGPLEDEKVNVSEELMAGLIVDRLPAQLEMTKEILFNTRPLTIEIVRANLDSRRFDNFGSLASETSSKAQSVRKKAPVAYCQNGVHNKNTRHSKSKCFQLHPELAPDTRKKRQAKKKQEDLPTENQTQTESVPIGGAFVTISGRAEEIEKHKDCIILNSCSPNHMFPDRRYFTNYRPSISEVKTTDGRSLTVEGTGFITLQNTDGVSRCFKALHVPTLKYPLISLCRLFSKGCDFNRGEAHQMVIHDSKKDVKVFDVEVSSRNICVVKATLVQP